MSSSDDECPPEAVPLAASLPPNNTSAAAKRTQQDAEQARVGAAGAAADTAAGAAGDSTAAPPPLAEPVPVTLITGYLGAGKSTLVNYVLHAKHGYRCAVLLNEIADSADIERALVKEPEGQEAAPLAEWTELENGCICCSAKNDMVKALESLMQQRSRFDYVLIETTGLANPGPVAAALWTDEQLESTICLDCIVTVVDARHIRRQLADRPAQGSGSVNEAQQQVAFADVVLLNKTDLASEPELAGIEGEIRGMNEEAGIVRCQRCEVDLALLLNTGLYSAGMRAAGAGSGSTDKQQPMLAHAAQQDQQQQQHEQCSDAQCSHPEHSHDHSGHSMHDARVGTVTVLLPGAPLDLARLRHWLDTLLWEETAEVVDVFRIKGLLHVAGSGRKHILQGVHEIYDIVEGPEWGADEPRGSKLVFIGRSLRRDALTADLHACLAA